MAQLDSLRALAVGGVLYAHLVPAANPLAALHVLPWGALGVQLFFVLSGFLITGILLDCRREIDGGRQSLGATLRCFYARGSLRIFPVYYLTLLLTAVTLWPVVRETLPWHLVFASNFYLADHGAWREPISPLGTLSALACVWAVDGAVRGFGGLAGRALDSRALRAVGRRSYAVYLFHPFAPRLLEEIAGPGRFEPASHAALAAQVALTLALASLSWRYVEAPINAPKDRFPYRRTHAAARPIALGAARPGGSP